MALDISKIREDFPILNEKVYGKNLIYFDNAATTQKPVQVIEKSDYLQRHINGNIHRGIHYMAEKSTELYENSRQIVADFLGADSRREIVFTSGATASLNLVAYCFSERYLSHGDNIVVTEMEHHSNIVPWQIHTERKDAELRYIPINDNGTLCIEQLDSIIDEKTRLVAVTETSNVLGVDNDVHAISEYCRKRNIPILVDGSQGVQHKRIDVSDYDFYVFSGHKLFAPTGIGVLYAKIKWLEDMPPYMGGGDMISTVSLENGTTWAELPLKYEAGTSNYIGAILLGEAINWFRQYDIFQVRNYLHSLTTSFSEQIKKNVDGVKVYGDYSEYVEYKAPIVSFNIDGCHPMDIAVLANRMGVAMRSGTQCAEPLMDHYGIKNVCRASMAIYNTKEEVDSVIDVITKVVKMLRR